LKGSFIILLFLALVVLAPEITLAQDESGTTFPLENFYVERKKPARNIFKNFRLGLSTGLGNTFFSHKLNGYSIYQLPGQAPTIYPTTSGANVRLTNWVNAVAADSSSAAPGGLTISSDTAKLGFKSNALNIPLKATLHYEYKKFRFGAGYSYELMSIGIFQSVSYGDKVNEFKLGSSTGFMKKYFGLLGFSFYRLDDYLLTADVNIGGFKPGANFDKSSIKKGIYVNLGVTVERPLSEYLTGFVRPSFDYKKYTLNVPGSAGIVHHINAFYINVGVTYTLPELKKCFHKECRIQINHAHGNKEYRSRVHPIYKKQNPGYGENDPTLIKYKGKNKRKLNPY